MKKQRPQLGLQHQSLNNSAPIEDQEARKSHCFFNRQNILMEVQGINMLHVANIENYKPIDIQG